MGQYDHLDYLRGVNALDLLDWLTDQNDDRVLLARLVERCRASLSRLERLLAGEEVADRVRRPPSVDGPFDGDVTSTGDVTSHLVDEEPVITGEVPG